MTMAPPEDPWTAPFSQRIRMMPKQVGLILAVMGALLAFIFVALGGVVLVGWALASGDGPTKPTVEAREAKIFGAITVVQGQDYRAFDASGDAPGQLGPGTLRVNNKDYTLNPATPLYGPGCPVVAQLQIPTPPLCFAQIGLAGDNKTVSFVTTMATPVPDDGGTALTYKGTVARSSNRQLVISDGTTLRWGNNPKFAATCRELSRDGFEGIVVEVQLDRFVGQILSVACPNRTG